MDFRQLETFVEVAKLKSFSKAAEMLFITQPTVTNHIQNLEKELGTILINRYGKNISLTDAGSLLYKYAINILNSCEMAKFDLASHHGVIQGHLNIYSSSVPRKYLLPNIMKSFLEVYPDVSFTLSERDSKEVVQGILDGETDFGILGAKYPTNSLKYIDLLEDRLVFVTPNTSKYPEDNFSELNVERIFSDFFISREEGSGTRALVEEVLKSNNIDPSRLNTIAYIEDTETIKEFISLGQGVSFLSERSIVNDLKLGRLKAYRLKGLNFNRKFYFTFHKNRQLSPLSESFKDHILKYIKTQD